MNLLWGVKERIFCFTSALLEMHKYMANISLAQTTEVMTIENILLVCVCAVHALKAFF